MNRLKTITITSARELTLEQQNSIVSHIAKILKQEISKLNFRFYTDQSIIGGLVFQIEDTLLDTSIAGKLQQLKQYLNKTLAL